MVDHLCYPKLCMSLYDLHWMVCGGGELKKHYQYSGGIEEQLWAAFPYSQVPHHVHEYEHNWLIKYTRYR